MKIRRLRKYRFPRTGELVTFETKQYYVTDDGHIYDGDRHRYVAEKENRGYLAVNLMDNEGKRHTNIGVHCLVVTCYQRLLQKGEDCHHIDHDRKNNNLSNLQIISAAEHVRQHDYEKWRSGTMDGNGVKMKKAWAAGAHKGHGEKVAARLSKQVAQLDMDGRLIKVWPSTQECGRNGFYHSAVSACCRGCYSMHRNNVYKCFKWMFYEDYLALQRDKAPVTAPVQLELNFTED